MSEGDFSVNKRQHKKVIVGLVSKICARALHPMSDGQVDVRDLANRVEKKLFRRHKGEVIFLCRQTIKEYQDDKRKQAYQNRFY